MKSNLTQNLYNLLEDQVMPANHSCAVLFSQIPCKEFYDTSYYVKACFTDYSLTQDTDAIQNSIEVYLKNAESASASTHENTDVADGPCGLFDHDCPNDCSGNGECNDHGCHCSADFFGYDCSTPRDKLVL